MFYEILIVVLMNVLIRALKGTKGSLKNKIHGYSTLMH